MKQAMDKQNINEPFDQDEQLWLSAVARLPSEKEPEVSEALRTKIKSAIEQERRTTPRKIIRWPAIAASFAAAALVVWLVVPGLFNQSRMPLHDMAPVSVETTHQITDGLADSSDMVPREESAVAPMEAVPADAPPEAIPESTRAIAKTESEPPNSDAFMVPMQAPELVGDEESMARDLSSEETSFGQGVDAFYVTEDLVLRLVPAVDLQGLDLLGMRVYRDTPHGRHVITAFLTTIEDEALRAEAERFVEDAFRDGYAIVIDKSKDY